MSIIHPRDVRILYANEVNRRVSYTHKEFSSVYSPHRALSDFLSMALLATNYPLGRESYIRALLSSPKLLFQVNVSAQSALWSEIPDSNRPFQLGRLTC